MIPILFLLHYLNLCVLTLFSLLVLGVVLDDYLAFRDMKKFLVELFTRLP